MVDHHFTHQNAISGHKKCVFTKLFLLYQEQKTLADAPTSPSLVWECLPFLMFKMFQSWAFRVPWQPPPKIPKLQKSNKTHWNRSTCQQVKRKSASISSTEPSQSWRGKMGLSETAVIAPTSPRQPPNLMICSMFGGIPSTKSPIDLPINFPF